MATPEYFTLEDIHRRMPAGSLGSVVVSEFRDSVLLDRLTFKNITGAHDEFKRETQLPTPQRRGVHGEFERTRSTNTLGTEGLRIYGTKMGHDRFLSKTGNFDVVSETRAHTRAIRLLLEYEVIYGDPFDDTDIGQVMGLQFLAANSSGYESETNISAGATAGGEPLSLRLFQDAIDNCFPRPTVIICGTTMKNVITTGSRDASVSGRINYTEDSFGRRIAAFDGIPILAMDRDHLNRKILPFNEAAASGPATAGSLYVLSHLPQEGGWYPFMNGGPFIEEDSGTSKPMKERDIEWYVAANRPQPTSVIRLRHIGNAAMVP